MELVLRADEIKPNFEDLKNKWAEMLGKYYLDGKVLTSEFTLEVACPYCASPLVRSQWLLPQVVFGMQNLVCQPALVRCLHQRVVQR